MKPAAASRSDHGVSRLRRIAPSVITTAAIAFVAVRFFGAAHATLARTRDGACTALKPDPLPFHNNAEPAAVAAMAAGAQGKFWQMHDKLFENNTALTRPDLEKYAQELGLDMAKFKADLDSQKYKDSIQSDTKEGQAVGVNGTPAVFINGRKINGAYPWETFKKIADAELKKKKG